MKRWYTEKEIIKIIGRYDAVIAGLDPFTANVLKESSNLKLIARRGIGYDNIDVKAARELGIKVSTTPIPEEHASVAEFTITLMLSLLRNITFANASLKTGSWEREKFVGKGMTDVSIGVVGLGHIGRRVAQMAERLGAKVTYYDPYVQDQEFRSVATLAELFEHSDLVTLHVPHTSETHEMVNSTVLERMKHGSYLVNTCRAEVVNTRDFKRALRDGTLAAAALDVFEEEPPSKTDPLLRIRNLIVTPHIAAGTLASFSKMDEICVDSVIRVLVENEEPQFRVV